ncbi:NADP oxidoreductase [Actinomadura sp. NBRC 104412]|nr:NADP oxidoreductase [Actinomadura sp. NBRC 104412]
MADALATQWARKGHEVTIGARTPEKAAVLAGRIGHGARSGGLREAAESGEVVLLAVWYEGIEEALGRAGAADGALEGRVLIDCVNATSPPAFTLKTGGGPSVAQRVAALAPGARVVKAFNLCHESVWRLTPPAFGGRPLGVPLCADDADALATVERLVTEMGCEPLHGGGLERAGLLEATAAFALGVYFGGARPGDPRAMFPPFEIATGGIGPVATESV